MAAAKAAPGLLRTRSCKAPTKASLLSGFFTADPRSRPDCQYP